MQSGQRVMSKSHWMPNQIMTRAGQQAPYGLAHGDLGTLVEETNAGSCVWLVVFDKDKSVEVIVSELFLEFVAEPTVSVKVEPQSTTKTCYCDTPSLMKIGCMCGAVNRYVEPHLRKP